jgi:histidyl-tRNA synthetase
MSFQPPKGTDDVLPPESQRWRRLLRVWDDISARYGYELVMTPIFEATDVFARAIGESTEVVRKQMFTWKDKGGRSMTLRPESTAAVVRAYLNAGRQGVFKGAHSGPMFRYEQPQAGRRRQFFQVSAEYLGTDAPEADVEVIELGRRFYDEVGIPDVEVQLNSIGDADSRATYREVLLAYLEQRRDELCDDCRERMQLNPLRVLDCKVDAPKLADAPAPVEYLNPASAEHFAAVRKGLERLGVPYNDAPRLVRGLDYYTRTVFEYTVATYDAAQDSLGGGGRYDGLAEQLGGPHVPAVGFSLGIDRVVLALADADEGPSLDVFVVATDSGRAEAVTALVASLRQTGLRADSVLEEVSVKSQFKAADRRGAAVAAVVGDELAAGKVTVRRLSDGHQEVIPIEEVESWAASH